MRRGVGKKRTMLSPERYFTTYTGALPLLGWEEGFLVLILHLTEVDYLGENR